METIRNLAYGYSGWGFPVVVWVGFATLALFAVAAATAGLKRWIRLLRRVSVRTHRRIAIAALLLAAAHLVMALSIYV